MGLLGFKLCLTFLSFFSLAFGKLLNDSLPIYTMEITIL